MQVDLGRSCGRMLLVKSVDGDMEEREAEAGTR